MPYSLDQLEKKGIPPLPAARPCWEKQRIAVSKAWSEMVKRIAEPAGTDYETVREEKEEGYIRKKIIYKTGDGDQVPANLLIPEKLERPCPAVLALHPTDAFGKDDISHPRGRKERQYGIELAKRGFAVLAPDAITAGDRVLADSLPFHTAAFYEKHQGWTAAGKMISDHKQAVSVLAGLQETDSGRIGVIGHSLGGYNAYFLSALDERIKACAISCGFSVFTGDPERNRWGEREWFSHFPELTQWVERGEVPFEYHEILALHAPRPLFVYMAMNDPIFPHWTRIAEGLKEVDGLYQVLEAHERLMILIGNGGHDFPASVRSAAIRFLGQWLL
ncbi:dienelactone hydrolase family protein [Metabacillus sp. GX 13764]|uniref:alpha/beta hydrolase family protein n=1 Tax=Metabacillus kandeliae TaxID=2900151 RepID=UPI001E617647|nr:alpha/beta fold hydrolase [Metabacillus kandeliae]MCD7032963.1 dienelactone hydrolase family protein [Metabacillus kandeliae]